MRKKKSVRFPMSYEPRSYQRGVFVARERGVQYIYCLWHRRAGKDLTLWHVMVREALTRVGSYVILFPTYAQARRVIWEGNTSDGASFLEMIPPEIIERKRDNDMYLRLQNGSSLQLLSAEHPDRLRGMNPVGVMLSEYAFQKPEVLDIISPIVAENHGFVILNTTPNGKNHAYELWESALKSPLWHTSKVKVQDSQVLAESVLETERSRLGEMAYRREYECDFLSCAESDGYYYAKALQLAREEGRVQGLSSEDLSGLRLHLAWDLGIRDATALWAWREGQDGPVFLKYWEERGKSLPQIAQEVLRWIRQKQAVLGYCFLPHDGQQRQILTGTTITQELSRLMRSRGKNVVSLPRERIHLGIMRCHQMLERAQFCREGCQEGLKALEHYKREYNHAKQTYEDTPLHDWASHGADALRYAALGVKILTSQVRQEGAPEVSAQSEATGGVIGIG